MANYTASIDASVRKAHSCVQCDTAFLYVMKRHVSATAASEAGAKEALHTSLISTMEGGVDTHPCPSCGMVQPEMVGAERSHSHLIQAILAGCLIPVFLLVAGLHAAHLSTVTTGAAVLYGLLAAWAFKTATTNPNSSLRGGVASPDVEILKEGDLETMKLKDPGKATDGNHPMAFVMLAASVLLCVSPALMRTVTGAPWNGKLYPAVVGPGDTATYYFNEEIKSLKGLWRGKTAAALVGLEGLGEDGELACVASTKDKDWGKNIRVKSSEKRKSSTIYSEVTIPGEAGLVGKTVEMRVRIVFAYPAMDGSLRFETKQGHIQELVEIGLAPAGFGAIYARSAWAGLGLGGLLLLIACLMLRSRAGGLDGNARQTLPAE